MGKDEWAPVKELLCQLIARLLAMSDMQARTFEDSVPLARMHEAVDEAIEIRRSQLRHPSLPAEVLNRISDLNRSIAQLREHADRCCVSSPGYGRKRTYIAVRYRPATVFKAIMDQMADSRVQRTLLSTT